mmetsp:Transcript_1473/g.2296  ORF Transcript_1473/g.2296 Transcript_1473/m.2296 type:complete len:87 (+) Transcript_1473:600-860(+)
MSHPIRCVPFLLLEIANSGIRGERSFRRPLDFCTQSALDSPRKLRIAHSAAIDTFQTKRNPLTELYNFTPFPTSLCTAQFHSSILK